MEFKRASEYNTEGFRAVPGIPRPRTNRGRYADLIDYFAMSNEQFMAKEFNTDNEAKIAHASIGHAIKSAGLESEMFTLKRRKTVYIAKGKREDFH